MPKKAPTFEDGLSRLEAIADEMERSELPLDKLMKLYDEGMKLAAELDQKLTQAQGHMQQVQPGENGAPKCQDLQLAQQSSLLDGLE